VKNVANYVLFNVGWYFAISGAVAGRPWLGPLAFGVIVIGHLALVEQRGRELRAILLIGLLGTLADCGLHALGATQYAVPIEGWPAWLVPPWITSLWVGFATLPRFSLGWLSGRPVPAIVFGAIGGPVSYWLGVRFGAVQVGPAPWVTWCALTLEYAVAMPLIMQLFPRTAGNTIPTEPLPYGDRRLQIERGSA
jgi:hypothetical protein